MMTPATGHGAPRATAPEEGGASHASAGRGGDSGARARKDGAGDSRLRGPGSERGSMTMELAILAPILVMFFMLMAGVGRVVEAQGQVEGAARDAARAASVARSRDVAESEAASAANATMSSRTWCRGGPRTTVDFADWRRGGQVSVAVTCDIDLTGLSLIGFAPTKTMTGRATVPLDTLRYIRDPVGGPPEDQ